MKARKLVQLAIALVVLALWAVPATAQAGPNDNSSDRPWALQFGLGPAVHLGPRGWWGRGAGGTHGRIGFDFQYHFKGGDVGPALGALATTTFTHRRFGMNVGVIFLWDFRVLEAGNFKLYVAPLVAAGHAFWHRWWDDRDRRRGDQWTRHWFFMDFGAQVKGVWNDRIGFFARPANFSMYAGPTSVHGYWSFISGLTLSF